MRDACHSPNIGIVVMATPTKVVSQQTAAWRVMNIFLLFLLLILEIDLSTK